MTTSGRIRSLIRKSMKLIWTNLFISRSNSSTSFMKSYDKPRDTHTTWHDVTLTHHVTGSLSRALKSKNHSKCIFSKNYFNVSGLQSLASDFSVFNDNVLSSLNEYYFRPIKWDASSRCSSSVWIPKFGIRTKWPSVRCTPLYNGYFLTSYIRTHDLDFGLTCSSKGQLEKLRSWKGYIDVDDKWVLVTLSWWQFLDDSDRISILVISFGYWCPALMFKDKGCWWQKRPKPSPTSQSCHQHISSPSSVSNIDVDSWKVGSGKNEVG